MLNRTSNGSMVFAIRILKVFICLLVSQMKKKNQFVVFYKTFKDLPSLTGQTELRCEIFLLILGFCIVNRTFNFFSPFTTKYSTDSVNSITIFYKIEWFFFFYLYLLMHLFMLHLNHCLKNVTTLWSVVNF